MNLPPKEIIPEIIPALYSASTTFKGIEYTANASTKHAAICNLCVNISRKLSFGEPTKVVTHYDKTAYFTTPSGLQTIEYSIFDLMAEHKKALALTK